MALISYLCVHLLVGNLWCHQKMLVKAEEIYLWLSNSHKLPRATPPSPRQVPPCWYLGLRSGPQ